MDSRIAKAYNDRLYLVESIPPENEDDALREYIVMGSTGNVYRVKIKNEPCCTCPDNRIRKARCKHIYFILLRVMKVDNEMQEYYDDEELIEMFKHIPKITHNLIANRVIRKKYKSIERKGKEVEESESEDNSIDNEGKVEQKKIEEDDECPICLDKLSIGEVDYCKASCGKSIHKKCFQMWCKQNKNICVYCRAEWVFENEKNRSRSRSRSNSNGHSKKKKKTKQGNNNKYINLLSTK